MFSDAYRDMIDKCAHFHLTHKTFSGNGCLKHVGRILDIAEEVKAESALDYGCGKGDQFLMKMPVVSGDRLTLEDTLGFQVAKFDPCVPAFAARPEGRFDLVWCVDVLELIPEQDMNAVLDELAAYAKKALFITVASYPGKKTFADGTNTHLTVKPAVWWTGKIARIKRANPDLRIEYLVG